MAHQYATMEEDETYNLAACLQGSKGTIRRYVHGRMQQAAWGTAAQPNQASARLDNT